MITLNHQYEGGSDGLAKKVYQVKGNTNGDLTFKDPIVVDISAN